MLQSSSSSSSSLLWNLLLPLLLTTEAIDARKISIDWQNVGTKKNRLIRRPISVQRASLGPPAQLCSPCKQDIYDKCVKQIYDGNSQLSIYERSDLLLAHIVDLEQMSRDPNATSSCPGLAAGTRYDWKDICGSNHLMACIDGQCKCMGEAKDVYPKYAAMKEISFTDPDDPSKIYRECRVSEVGALCNTHGLLFCDTSATAQLRCVTSSHRCRCEQADPSNPEHWADGGEIDDTLGINVTRLPLDNCHPRVRFRGREYQ